MILASSESERERQHAGKRKSEKEGGPCLDVAVVGERRQEGTRHSVLYYSVLCTLYIKRRRRRRGTGGHNANRQVWVK